MHDTRSFLCILVDVFQHNIWGSLLVLVSFGKSRQIREAVNEGSHRGVRQ